MKQNEKNREEKNNQWNQKLAQKSNINDKSLARLTKRKIDETQVTKTRNKIGNITTELTEINKIRDAMKKVYKQIK